MCRPRGILEWCDLYMNGVPFLQIWRMDTQKVRLEKGQSFQIWLLWVCICFFDKQFQLMVNCWFGLVVWDAPSNNPFIFGDPRNPNHRAPKQQLTISWQLIWKSHWPCTGTLSPQGLTAAGIFRGMSAWDVCQRGWGFFLDFSLFFILFWDVLGCFFF